MIDKIVQLLEQNPHLVDGAVKVVEAIVRGDQTAAVLHADATAAKQAAKLEIRRKKR